MKALIDATGNRLMAGPLLYYKPTPLFCVGGKPIIFHIIEFLLQRNIKDFHVILNHLPIKIEHQLGNGQRWGVNIFYHLAKDCIHPFQAIRPVVQHFGDESVIFALGDSLPWLDQEHFVLQNSCQPRLYLYPNRKWTGWGVLPLELLKNAPKNLVEEDLPGLLNGRYEGIQVLPFLSAHSLKALHESNKRFLTLQHPSSTFPTKARLVQPGVWISRGVSLHPTAKIIPPVFIGEFSQINKNTIIGPYVTIEDFSIIDEDSDLVDSLVCQRSYVGEGLSVHNSIVDRNLLINLAIGSHIVVRDDFILGASYPRSPFYWVLGLLEKMIALFLLILTYPFYLMMFANHHLRSIAMLKLPTNDDLLTWETFKWETFELNAGLAPSRFFQLFAGLPLLKAILRGNVHFVGVIPRTPQEVEKMPVDWKRLYLSSKVGVITISDLEDGNSVALDECYASETLYAARKGLWYDIQLLFKWLTKKIKKINS